MTFEELKQLFLSLLESLPPTVDNLHIHLHLGEVTGDDVPDWPDEPDDPIEPPEPVDPAPATLLIEVVEGESFKKVVYWNDAGVPVMDTAVVGWRSEPGQRYLAEVDPIRGDGGTLWWKLWIGPAGIPEEEQLKVRGYYLNKDKCKKV